MRRRRAIHHGNGIRGADPLRRDVRLGGMYQDATVRFPPIPAPTLASEGCDPDPRMVRTEDLSASMFDFRTEVATCCWVLPACIEIRLMAKLATSIRTLPQSPADYPGRR